MRTLRSVQHFSGISLFASTSSTETDKNIITSKHHILFTAFMYLFMLYPGAYSLVVQALLRTPDTCLQFPWVSAACISVGLTCWCYAHFCCRGPAPRAGWQSSAQVAAPVWSHRFNGDGILSSQGLPQLVKLLKETLNGEVCQEIIISLCHRSSLNSLLITGNIY